MSEDAMDQAAAVRQLLAYVRDPRLGDAVLLALANEGWSQKNAVHETERLFRLQLERLAANTAELAQPAPVPEPLPLDGPASLTVDGRQIQVLAQLASPRAIVFGGLLSEEECDALVALARAQLQPSQTLNEETGSYEANTARSSRGTYFRRRQNALCERIDARIAALLRWPIENGEDLQVLHYGVGAEYLPHHDYFDPDRPGTDAVLQRGGQRVASLVMYLNTPQAGGATIFPEAGFQVGAVKGNAVFFSYDRAHPITRTLHGGAPVLQGEKWVATKWLRQGKYA